MNGNDHFDELARRKLQEADFPFQEEDWARMHALILAQRASRKRRIASILALLLIGGTATWWGTSDRGPESGLTPKAHLPSTPAPVAADVPSSTPAQPAAPSGAGSATTLIVEGGTSPVEDHSVPADPSPNVASAPSDRIEPLVEQRPASGTPLRTAPANTAQHLHVNTDIPAPTQRSLEERTEGVEQGDPTPSTEQLKDGATPTEATIVTTTEVTARPTHIEPSAAEPMVTGNPEPLHGTNTEETPKEQAAAVQGTETGTAPMASVPTIGSKVNDTLQEPSTDSIPPVDTLATAATDSAVAPPPVPLVPLINARAPWELTGWFGIQNNRNNRNSYSGEGSTAWRNGVTAESTTTMGLEVMHMGKHLGFGAGLYYTTYAERLDVQALDRTSTTYTPRWYLMPVDTVIFHVTAVLPGGQMEGYSIDTTINVIQLTTDTGVVTMRVREARRMVNRVSYVEIPLLADLHLAHERWSFGVRGGPTLGLLSARRGFLPTADGEDYSPLSEEPFRTLMWGYQATAYLRYRFHPAWSIGIGPGVRGQLGNALERTDLTRQAAAWNASIGITYRLP